MTRTLVAVGVVLLVVVAAACGASQHQAQGPSPTTAARAARTFLDTYVTRSGQVVRYGEGSDTVSEGQAYAMLLDVAVDDRRQFATVWQWSQTHLMDSDGLLAYHWEHGKVADHHSATDADLDVARALILAGTKWHDTRWSVQGRAYAKAILINESVVLDGQRWLVAGPWARTAPYFVDPSYYDPATFQLLAETTGDRRWGAVETSSAKVIVADTDNGQRLPSDWAQVESSGEVQASSPPGGGSIQYGYDAFRTLVRQDDSCTSGPARALDARLARLSARTASRQDRADTYQQNGAPSQAGNNPFMAIAAAGAAAAANEPGTVRRDLGTAAEAEVQHGSYYLDAWVALGRVLLTTSTLSTCSP
jgi:endoglucanase